jgi:AcrR family transcriptional regulator
MLRVARRHFLATGSLEMRGLALELGIGRATLYRWARTREALLGEVIADLGRANLRRAEASVHTAAGPARLCDVHDLHLRRISESSAMHSFIRREPQVASRVLLDVHGRVHTAVTEALADLVRRQRDESGWTPPLPVDDLAEMVARLSEAFLYADLIARAEPDVSAPDALLRLILGLPATREPQRAPGAGPRRVAVR